MAPTTRLYETGDTMYYPKIWDPDGQEMTVTDRLVKWGKYGVYAHYLSSDLLDRLVEEMHRNIENHYDNIVVITGEEGVGKSNLAYWVAKKFDPKFDIQEGYVYDMLPFLEKLQKGNLNGRVLWLDEGTNLLSARNWMSDTNKSVDQILEMFRSYKMTLIICIPKLYRLDEYVRESRMRYHLIADQHNWEGDPYVKRGYFECKRWPDFKTVCWGTFPEIPPEDKKIYEGIKASSQQKKAKEILEKFQDDDKNPRLQKAAKYNRKMAWLLKKQGLSYEEISDETGIPEGTLRYWIHENQEDA